MRPQVDVNLFVFNSAETIEASIDSVLAQTWPALALTVIDDGSTDGTAELIAARAAADPRIRLMRRAANAGAIASFQQAFRHGEAAFVMPKSGDDLIAPDFIERVMAVLLEHPGCAMCHAAGAVFTEAEIAPYPPEHRLFALGTDPVARARHVMAHYTSSPSFWGIYRRAASDRLSPIRYRAGWDHALLAELALFGEIRHVPDPLYLRRNGGRPVLDLARAATLQARAGLDAADPLGDPRWRTPLITTAFAHIETFATAAAPAETRRALIASVPPSFRRRWLPLMQQEALALRASAPPLMAHLAEAAPAEGHWMASNLLAAFHASEAIVPEADLASLRQEVAALMTKGRSLAA